MSFNFGTDTVVIVQLEYPRIVLKTGNNAGMIDCFCRILEPFEERWALDSINRQFCLKGFVSAVFGPGLSQGFNFRIIRIPPDRSKIVLYCLHFVKCEKESILTQGQ